MPTLLFLAVLAASDPAAVHRRAVVIDTHADTTQRLLDEGYDLVPGDGSGHLDLASARAGNLGAEFFSIWVDAEHFRGHYRERADALIDAVLAEVKKHPEELVLAVTADDIVKARRGPRPRFAMLMGVEGGHAIENDLGVLEGFYRRGVRYMTLTHSHANDWAGSSGDDKPEAPKGLSPFGEQVVATMNRLGMMVDVSHVSDATFADVLRVTKAPVLASHSSARALCDVLRNMSDDMLRAVARNGGVVQVNFFPVFLDPEYSRAWTADHARRDAAEAALEASLAHATPKERSLAWTRFEREEGARYPRPPLSKLVDHLDHIAKVAGVDHVGLGSDFDGVPSLPQGMDSAADLPKLTTALLARGYSEADVEKILGGNLLRVMRAVELVARQTAH
jgi:membrane dipeptidase